MNEYEYEFDISKFNYLNYLSVHINKPFNLFIIRI